VFALQQCARGAPAPVKESTRTMGAGKKISAPVVEWLQRTVRGSRRRRFALCPFNCLL